MVTMRGAHFARKLLTHLNAEVFARPPMCAVRWHDHRDPAPPGRPLVLALLRHRLQDAPERPEQRLDPAAPRSTSTFLYANL